MDDTEIKLPRFQIYHKTEVACKYSKSLLKTQYSEFFVQYKNSFDMKTCQVFKI